MRWIGGGALGFAILVTAYGTAVRDSGVAAVPGNLPPDAQTHGITTAFAAGTGFTTLACLIALVVIRTVKPAPPRCTPMNPAHLPSGSPGELPGNPAR